MRRALAVAAVAGALLLSAAPSAQAAEDGIEFSVDGITWSPTAPTALFPSGIPLVPGGSATTTLHLRNGNAGDGVLVVAVAGIHAGSAQAAESFGLAGRDQLGEGMPRTALAMLAECTHLVPSRVLAPGEEVAVTVTTDLDSALTGREVQRDRMGFTVRIGLTDARAAAPSTSGCSAATIDIPVVPPSPVSPTPTPTPTQPGGSLPVTGGRVNVAAVVLGAVLGGVGWLLIALARRKRKKESPSPTR